MPEALTVGEWVRTTSRVPTDRMKVLVWGYVNFMGCKLAPGGAFLGETKFNPSVNGGMFDCERYQRLVTVRVTHWAVLRGPSPMPAL
jgi:hypothetical protein